MNPMINMSTITFRHESSRMEEDSKGKHLVKENITDGEKGLSIMFLKKEAGDFYKFYIKENKETGKYEGTEKKGEDEKEITMSSADLKKYVSANKYLHFAKDYMDNPK